MPNFKILITYDQFLYANKASSPMDSKDIEQLALHTNLSALVMQPMSKPPLYRLT